MDLPSHGRSDVFPKLSLEFYVEVLNAFIQSSTYEKIILCGHSLGGAIIQEYYFKNLDSLIALILVGTGAKLKVNPFILNSLKDNYKEYLNSLPAGDFYRKTSKDVINEYVLDTTKIGSEVTYQDFSICDNFDTLSKSELIKIPCLILVGKGDILTPVKYSTYFHDKIKYSELLIVEHAGHMVMLEKPLEINKAISKFIEKLT
jgi:pimeloyl-ACP methyl ester carboxylesterase